MIQSGQILFNKYRIEKLIGKGAFGEVYLVTHLSLKSVYALKVLAKNMQDVESKVILHYRERFYQEARLGARIKHPNIIHVFDVEDQDGILALVMDYAPGGNLAEQIARTIENNHALPVSSVLSIANDIASGLSELHRLDIIHRDLKPSNILFDEQGKALIADLGIAQSSDGITSRTHTGDTTPAHPGTPAYMSPEQESKLGYLQPPSDVYSLGLILFELLAGRNYKNYPPGTRISKIRKDVPKSLADLINQSLKIDPKDRPWDGAEVCRKLKKINNGSNENKKLFFTLGTFSIILIIGFFAWRIFGSPFYQFTTNISTPSATIVIETPHTVTESPSPYPTILPTLTITGPFTTEPKTTSLPSYPTITNAPDIVQTKIKTIKAWLRKGPGLTHPIVNSLNLNKGDDVRLISRASNIWFFVETSDGTEGWLYIEWLESGFSVDSIPLALTTPTPPPPEPTEIPTNNPSNNKNPPVYPPPP